MSLLCLCSMLAGQLQCRKAISAMLCSGQSISQEAEGPLQGQHVLWPSALELACRHIIMPVTSSIVKHPQQRIAVLLARICLYQLCNPSSITAAHVNPMAIALSSCR